MPIDHEIPKLIINKLTTAQYEQAVKNADELYLTPDDSAGLPDQTGQSGKFLTTNGSTVSWGTVSVPTVNNSTITIQKNSTTVDSFTLNQSSNKTIDISVPTATSDITNDSGYITSSDIPTNVSAFTNDAGYLTAHQSIKTLKTDNTTGQTTSSSETIAGSGTINLHKVSKTGSYTDLLDKPTIPTITDTYSSTSSDGMSGKAVASAISNKADKATSLSGYGITDAYTKTEVNGMISSVYKPAGSVAFASLPTLSSSVLGNVYNVTDAFTTTSDFVEGSGNSYPAGTNVVVVNTGTSSSPTYKFDVLSGFVDLSGYVPTSRTINGKALTGNISLSASDVGALPDSTTIPQGTVTSVRVQAGTGLSSSVSTAQSTSLDTTISIASGYKLPTTSEWSGKQDALPSQSGNSGKFLTTNGTTTSWAESTTWTYTANTETLEIE